MIILVLLVFLFFILMLAYREKIEDYLGKMLFSKPSLGKKADWRYICPRCGSLNLKSQYLISPVELSRPGSLKLKERFPKHPIGTILLGWHPQNPSVYICRDCDYYGTCPEVIVTKIKEFQNRLRDE